MNKARRKNLETIIAKLEAIREPMGTIWNDLREVADEEQEAYDNMPESLQESERGQQMQEYIDTMDGVLDEIESCDWLEDLIDQLQEIVDG